MKYIVVEPHADDALIGCFHLFRKGLVKAVICRDKDKNRVAETQKFCKAMNVEMITVSDVKSGDVVLLPSWQDDHFQHKQTNVMYRALCNNKGASTGFYTTNMNTEFTRELPPWKQKEKLSMLNTYYSSQSDLWKYDYKYWLFEGVVVEC